MNRGIKRDEQGKLSFFFSPGLLTKLDWSTKTNSLNAVCLIRHRNINIVAWNLRRTDGLDVEHAIDGSGLNSHR